MNPQQIHEKNIIFAADLPENTKEEDLKKFFKDYLDKIIMINMMTKKSQFIEHSNSSAKIIFRDSQSANDARLRLNQLKFNGKAIRLMWDEKSQIFKLSQNNCNLFIKGVPSNVSQRAVYEHFLQYGDILSAKMSEDEYGRHLGYGYITYYDQENALKAIQECDGKKVFGIAMEVKFYKKKAERNASSVPEENKIFLKNFPANFNQNDILTLCEDYGEIINYNINIETVGKKFAVISYSNPESAKNAEKGLNQKNIRGYPLFCEIFKTKHQLVGNKAYKGGMNYSEKHNLTEHRFQEQCNLLIKNIPSPVTDEILKGIFGKFGEIKSAKIDTYTYMQKIKDEYKQIPVSKGIGYVCFANKEDAEKAKDAFHGKYLPGYESWNKPIIIDFWIPKAKRDLEYKPQIPFDNGLRYPATCIPFNPQMPYHQPIPPVYSNPIPQPYINTPSEEKERPVEPPQVAEKNESEVKDENKDILDEKYLNSLELDEDKKQYLGEIIFKLVESHPIAQSENLTIDTIGRITGMIINIEDLNEIIEVCRNENTLVSRINEALELLNGSK